MLNLLYTSSKTLTLTGEAEVIFVPNADAMYLANPISGSSRYKRLYRDGTVLDVGTNNHAFTINFDNIDNKDGVVVTLESASTGHIIERMTWISDFNRPIAANMTKTNMNKGVFLNDRTGVRKYYFPTGGGYTRYDEATGASEATVVVTASFTIDSIHFMKEQQVCLFDYSAGRVFFYDVASESLVLETSIEVAKTACFDTTYQNVISIRNSDFAVQVYDSKARAFKLSALTVSPGTYDRYKTEDVSVTVLGSDDEPIADIDVQWKVQRLINVDNSINTREINALEVLAGASFLAPKGSITPAFTKTNSNGVATAVYCPPGLDWVIGDTEVIIPTVRQ